MADTTPDQLSGRFVLAAGAAVEIPLASVVERCLRESGRHLVAVVLFGSYARGTHLTTSDIDVLLVVDHDVTRALYNSWDAEPMRVDGHPVDAHFVRMPDHDQPITSLWAEVAVEGAVLFDPSLAISR